MSTPEQPQLVIAETREELERLADQGAAAVEFHSNAAEQARMAKIFERREPILHRAMEVAGAQSWGDAWQSGFRDFPDLPSAARRTGVPGLNLGRRAITPPLDGNSAEAHPIAPDIERGAARGGYPYHGGTAGRYPCPGDCARHDNVRRIRSTLAAGSARRKGSAWASTPPSPSAPSARHRHSSSDSGQAARAA